MPTHGLSKTEIQDKQCECCAVVNENLEKKFELIEAFTGGENYSPLECLAENLKRIAKASYVAFFDDWENDRDCKIVKMCIEAYGISYINVQITNLI